MQQLTAKLNALAQETGEGGTKKVTGKGGDEFSGLKGQVAQEVRDIRAALKERDELLQKGASGTKQTVQMSHQIRTQIKTAKEDAKKLLQLQQKEAAKKDKKGANATQARPREREREKLKRGVGASGWRVVARRAELCSGRGPTLRPLTTATRARVVVTGGGEAGGGRAGLQAH